MGRSVSARILAGQKLSKNKELETYINTLGNYLALHSDRPNTYRGYQFAVIESKTPSAMSAPGGYIYISTAMLKKVKNEEELAAILAHEVAHIVLEHAKKAIKSKNMWKSVSKYGSILLSAATGGDIDADQGEAFANIVGGLAELRYNKNQELAADIMALRILTSAGDDANCLLTFLTRFQSDASFLSNHPRSESRLSGIRRELKKLKNRGGSVARNKRYSKKVRKL